MKGNLRIENLPPNDQERARKRLEKAKKYNAYPTKSWQTFKNHYNTFPMRFGDTKKIEKITDILFPRSKSRPRNWEEDVRQVYAHLYEQNDVLSPKMLIILLKTVKESS